MAPYLLKQVAVYACPADFIPSANGLRVRAASMNGQMGYNVVNLDEVSYSAGYLAFAKTRELTELPPVRAFIFCDESMFSLNDGYLQMGLDSVKFINGLEPLCRMFRTPLALTNRTRTEVLRLSAAGLLTPRCWTKTGSG
jgi:hypothetical protein